MYKLLLELSLRKVFHKSLKSSEPFNNMNKNDSKTHIAMNFLKLENSGKKRVKSNQSCSIIY